MYSQTIQCQKTSPHSCCTPRLALVLTTALPGKIITHSFSTTEPVLFLHYLSTVTSYLVTVTPPSPTRTQLPLKRIMSGDDYLNFSPYGYTPTGWVCVTFIILFVVLGCVHTALGVKFKYWIAFPTLIFGCLCKSESRPMEKGRGRKADRLFSSFLSLI